MLFYVMVLNSATQPMLGSAGVFLDMLEHVSRLAPLNRPVLVIGERGTGKELMAARLHYLSPRWEGPFVTLNCAALPENLLEAELFGYEAGAFTGATRARGPVRGSRRRHAVSRRDRDRLARPPRRRSCASIEYGEFERIGAQPYGRGRCPAVAATNVDLPVEAETGRFRADLLDRLAFDVVTLPPLRERPGDILLLADHFGLAMIQELKRPVFPGFSTGPRAVLAGHDWPGNVRELKNVVERAVYRADGSGPADRHHPARPFRLALPAAPRRATRNRSGAAVGPDRAATARTL